MKNVCLQRLCASNAVTIISSFHQITSVAYTKYTSQPEITKVLHTIYTLQITTLCIWRKLSTYLNLQNNAGIWYILPCSVLEKSWAFIFGLPAKYLLQFRVLCIIHSDQRDDKWRERSEIHTELWSQNQKGRYNLEDLGIDDKTSKKDLKEWVDKEPDTFASEWPAVALLTTLMKTAIPHKLANFSSRWVTISSSRTLFHVNYSVHYLQNV